MQTSRRPGDDELEPGAYDLRQMATKPPDHGAPPPEVWDGRETPPWVILAWAVLLSIPLGLCCYLLLKL